MYRHSFHFFLLLMSLVSSNLMNVYNDLHFKLLCVNCANSMNVIKRPTAIEINIVMLIDVDWTIASIHHFHFDINWSQFKTVASFLNSIQSFIFIVSDLGLFDCLFTPMVVCLWNIMKNRIFYVKSTYKQKLLSTYFGYTFIAIIFT